MEINNLFSTNRTPINFMVWGLIMIAISGLVLGITYYVVDITHTQLLATDCVLTNNAFGETCQDIFAMVLYPFLAAKSILVYLSIFMIFILVIGILISGYNSGTSPKMLGVLFILEIIITYGSILVANIYTDLLNIEVIRIALTEFTVYNNIMLYLPLFVFIVSLFSLVLGVMNLQRTRVNSSSDDLNY